MIPHFSEVFSNLKNQVFLNFYVNHFCGEYNTPFLKINLDKSVMKHKIKKNFRGFLSVYNLIKKSAVNGAI